MKDSLAHIDKSGRTQEQVVFLHGFRVNDAEIAADV